MNPELPKLPALCAKDDAEAASTLGISRTTLWRRTMLPKGDPRRIRRTSYGKIPLAELERHLNAELAAA